MTWYIHRYEIQQKYGGPEEGGWWYTAGEPTGFTFGPLPCTEDEAHDQCRALNELEHERAEREEDYGFTSVLSYRSTHYDYDVSQDPTRRTELPEITPHYE